MKEYKEKKYPEISDALTNFEEDAGYLLRKLQVGQHTEKKFKALFLEELATLKKSVLEAL